MKKAIFILFIAAGIMSCKDTGEKSQKEQESERIAETEAEKPPQDWTMLFDGTSTDGWKEYAKDSVSDYWKIEDNSLVFDPPKERERGEQYNLVTEMEYTDFVLSLDWKISEGGNSGIMWGVKEDKDFDQPYRTGPEIQILDNERHPDAKAGKTHRAGALYDMQAPSKEAAKPAGEWNTMVIMVNNSKNEGSVELNGEDIVDFPVGNEIWNTMVSKSKFADWDGFGKFVQGKIALQDHGNKVWFRNIKIKEL